MNNTELKLTISEIDKLISRHKFRQAAELADTVDWRRIKDVRTLCRVSDVYKINRRFEDSKRILELAYAKKPGGRQIIYSLCELELKLGNQVRALQLYNEYINIAPAAGFFLVIIRQIQTVWYLVGKLSDNKEKGEE